MKYLDENGYVVFKNVASQDDLDKGYQLAWDFLETIAPVDRNNPSTWNHPKWPDPFGKGIVAGDGVGQSSFLWFCRGLPKVKSIFQNIWGADDLITSFDGFCMHRPFEYNESFKTKEGWYHIDQNGTRKPGKICVQGFLNFFPGGLDDGGLVVVPKSHLIFNDIFKEFPNFAKISGDFVQLHNQPGFWNGIAKKNNLHALKVCCQPGDFVLWDSRTIHCNSPARTYRDIPAKGVLLPRRLVAYVCMTPKSRMSEECLHSRIAAFKTGQTTSHWPEECFTASARKNWSNTKYTPPELSEETKLLIPL